LSNLHIKICTDFSHFLKRVFLSFSNLFRRQE